MIRIPILPAGSDEAFPALETALAEPNGLLAAGGDLSPRRLLDAYRHGIFPWYSRDEPILWWSPDPRMVLRTDGLHVSTRLRRFLRGCDWTVRADTAFAEVMRACAAPRAKQPTTWITRDMFEAYCELHRLGHAHSCEVHAGDELVGGIYGVAVGRMFFGESMFSARTNGSKVALLGLCHALQAWGFPLLDAQVRSEHLVSLGAVEMPRAEFVRRVAAQAALPGFIGSWCDRLGEIEVDTLAG
ncbi:MAG: leucyl/phenylalanyl-tRNA--protein transferase [Rudaea sp.]|uniref:leucyl/phenylalanyl-tRNA--protein transferase n=1 Tax=Rudaea sp. TaxID=2136325 RepID=UPI0039E2BCC6